jgi:hypothetical protein
VRVSMISKGHTVRHTERPAHPKFKNFFNRVRRARYQFSLLDATNHWRQATLGKGLSGVAFLLLFADFESKLGARNGHLH